MHFFLPAGWFDWTLGGGFSFGFSMADQRAVYIARRAQGRRKRDDVARA